MKPTMNDIIGINQVLSLWGHVLDRREWDRFSEVLTEDAFYDCSIFGFEPVTGIESIREIFKQDGHAKAHHTTNTYVQEGAGTEFNVESKGLGLLADGRVASVTFVDVLRSTPAGWRLASRVLKF
jgi:hypothetical protein